MLSSNKDPQKAGDVTEEFEFGYEPVEKNQGGGNGGREGAITVANVWPAKLPGLREAALQY